MRFPRFLAETAADGIVLTALAEVKPPSATEGKKRLVSVLDSILR
jgi:hypothetical protein